MYLCIEMKKSGMFQVDEMTAVEADHLLTDRLMERRSRAGSVLSDKEVNK